VPLVVHHGAFHHKDEFSSTLQNTIAVLLAFHIQALTNKPIDKPCRPGAESLTVDIMALKYIAALSYFGPVALFLPQAKEAGLVMVGKSRGGENDGHEGENDGQGFHGVAPSSGMDDSGEHSTGKPLVRQAEIAVAGAEMVTAGAEAVV